MIQDLEQYYLEVFQQKGMPEFSSLTEQQIKVVQNSIGFSLWKFGKAKSNFVTAFVEGLRRVAAKITGPAGRS